ncbi:DUF1343 domain-containing protein [Seonamhaeicola sp. NFXS20]|uniref:exo-beta-N-acetylmuramidase NamZ family protein n=1 Tax=Seonamhaeicola sp. NFXS20 TaxID=2816959 RepID=UPI003B8CA4EA
MQKQISRIILQLLVLFLCLTNCQNKSKKQVPLKETAESTTKHIIVGANQTEKYLDLLKGKRIALAANNTSVIFKSNDHKTYTHLADSLKSLNINIVKIFAPEHGLRGKIDAGEVIKSEIDEQTGIPVVSLYGTNDNSNSEEKFKPSEKHLNDLDVVVFDIQDVGARFYTYLSTLHYIMEACAEKQIPVIVLDRPNPNGHYIDGPIVEENFKSFVGLHPVPIVYGMTIGEYAKMINGEKWLKNGVKCNLTVIPLKNYTHSSTYSLTLRPSPNLPNDKSINLYPSLCLFEGTNVNCGRGTDMQFQIFGSPDLPSNEYNFSFTPQPNFGSKNPKNINQECFGLDLSKTNRLSALNFEWLINAYNATANKDKFFRERSFNILAGTDKLKKQIENGLSFEEIKATWEDGLTKFKNTRKKYLIYP